MKRILDWIIYKIVNCYGLSYSCALLDARTSRIEPIRYSELIFRSIVNPGRKLSDRAGTAHAL